MTDRLVLSGATLIDGRQVDIVVDAGIIAAITSAGANGASAVGRVIDCSGLYVSSGWIDLHVHAFPELDPYGDEMDEIGVKQGVAVIVDAGSCGADRIGELAASREKAMTTMFALLNVSKIGLQRIDELSDLAWLDRDAALQAVQAYPDFIVGWKARMSGSVVRDSGIRPLHIAKELSEETGLPLMVHIGSAPPRIEDILPLLARKDVVTHYLNGKSNNLFREEGSPIPELGEAIARGVHMDVGHGTASFSFKVAEAAKRNGIRFHTISSDIYRANRQHGPVYSLAHVMSKFLCLGYSLSEVIEAVTANAAEWLGKPELGRIRAGDRANLTLFSVKEERALFFDSEGETREGENQIIARGVCANGRFIEC
ncbi:amidohydrolase/deacetylase family metallohydrolase [Paenibacillus lignilyticus]|uniref:Amidohydrolase/deacetylase family metallohydrolase n=1 Tax=Paenibacillus lignilyticus TaxID=1172615 RepID=A0ABS5CIW9_9BACL|nr:amidohydrolase/deacetylase family metallohydrolase [Paenibacillus lignilyticus]MBP3965835.1 amidohydrolase/deacetylase family metallohydrolase [Paenibacillus lignilyticus]